MTYVATIWEAAPAPRVDAPWTQVRIEEAPASTGPWTPLETRVLNPVDADPADPQLRSFTTTLATIPSGWYRLIWRDAEGHEDEGQPVYSNVEESVYTSIASLRRALAPGGSDSPTLGTAASLDEEDLYQAIAEAAAEINGRIGQRYSLPFASPAPSQLETLNRDIAAYLATLVYRRNTPLPADDPIRLRYARAQAMLAAIASGEIELTGAAGVVGESADAEVVNMYEGDLFSLEESGLSVGAVTWPWAPPY